MPSAHSSSHARSWSASASPSKIRSADWRWRSASSCRAGPNIFFLAGECARALSEILIDLIVQDLDVLAPHRRAPSDRRNNAGREEGEASEQADVPFDGGARTRHGRQ